MGLQPGEVFVHRNIANIISSADINSMAVIEYAVDHLKVKHIVLCGHTCCGGAGAALSDGRVGGVIDAWITPLKALRKQNQKEIDALKGDTKAVRLAELNVEYGVQNLMANYVVDGAIKKRGLQVHGTIYDVASGKMKNLLVGTDTSGCNTSSKHSHVSKGTDGAADEEPIEIVTGNHGILEFNGDEAKLSVR